MLFSYQITNPTFGSELQRFMDIRYESPFTYYNLVAKVINIVLDKYPMQRTISSMNKRIHNTLNTIRHNSGYRVSYVIMPSPIAPSWNRLVFPFSQLRPVPFSRSQTSPRSMDA